MIRINCSYFHEDIEWNSNIRKTCEFYDNTTNSILKKNSICYHNFYQDWVQRSAFFRDFLSRHVHGPQPDFSSQQLRFYVRFQSICFTKWTYKITPYVLFKIKLPMYSLILFFQSKITLAHAKQQLKLYSVNDLCIIE